MKYLISKIKYLFSLSFLGCHKLVKKDLVLFCYYGNIRANRDDVRKDTKRG